MIVEKPPFFRLHHDMPVARWATDLLSGFFHEAAPGMRQFAAWVRSFRHFGFMVSLPWVHSNGQRLGTDANRERYYVNGEFDFRQHFQDAYDRSVDLLTLAYGALEAGDESDVARSRFLAMADISDLAYPVARRALPPLPEYEELLPVYEEAGLRAVG